MIAGGRGAGEIDVDPFARDGHGGSQRDRLVVAVHGELVAVGALGQLGDGGQRGCARALDDLLAEPVEIGEFELVHHGEQAVGTGPVAGDQRVNVAFELERLAHVPAHHLQQVLVDPALAAERHDRDVETLLEHGARIGPEAAPADVDHVGGAGEGADHPAFAEHRRHHREVVQVAAGEPRVVGDVDIALAHDLVGVAGEEVLHRNGHRVDVAGRAGDRLGEHPALGVEDAGGEVACLAHGGAEGGAQKRLRLLLHHRDQAVPHDLRLDLCEPGLGRAVHQASSPCAGRRSITMVPNASTEAVNAALTTAVVSVSTISAGPSTRAPATKSARR